MKGVLKGEFCICNYIFEVHKLIIIYCLSDDVVYWDNKENQVNTTDKQSDYWFLAPSIDIETAAYAIRTYALRLDPSGALPVLTWLITKQNRKGGFSSTQVLGKFIIL